MNVGHGGKQATPRESKIPSEPEMAALHLGPYDPQLKPGDTQFFYFREGDAPPFNYRLISLTRLRTTPTRANATGRASR
jgi:hypothetical protein